MDKRERTHAEKNIENVLESQEFERNERLDKIVAMQKDLRFKRVKYNLGFLLTSVLATMFMVSIAGMPPWVGILFFLGVFFALRYFYLDQMFVEKYNEHVKGMYEDK